MLVLAMLRGRTAGFPQNTGWPGLRRGGVGGYNLHSPPDCGTPTTSRLYPFGAHNPLQPLGHNLSNSGYMEVIINHPYTEAWQGHLPRNFLPANLVNLPSCKSPGICFYQQSTNISSLLKTNTVSDVNTRPPRLCNS